MTDERGNLANTLPDTRTILSALRVQASIGELERELDRLRNGLRLEPCAARPELDTLERFRSALHEFGQAERTRSVLRGLSALPNRASFEERLRDVSGPRRDEANGMTLLLIGIDDFSGSRERPFASR